MNSSEIDLTIIIPFFNEENELEDLLKDIKNFETKFSGLVGEYIFINDCSTDSSLEKVKFCIKNLECKIVNKIKIISNEKNLGWCKSLIKGYNLAQGKSVLFIPGDGEAKLTEFLGQSINLDKDIIIFKRKNMIGRPKMRIIISFIYRWIIGLMFFVKPIDFNGLIILKTSKIEMLKLSSDSFFISAEIIVKSIKLNFSKNFENKFSLVPKNKYKSSSLSLNQFLKIFKDMYKLYLFLLKRFDYKYK